MELAHEKRRYAIRSLLHLLICKTLDAMRLQKIKALEKQVNSLKERCERAESEAHQVYQ